MNDLESFFMELKSQYAKERSPFMWEWPINVDPYVAEEMVRFLAFNLSKNVMHGPLPSHLHARMILKSGEEWGRKYVEFLEE